MTYQQTLEWMFGKLPMYQHKGKSAYTAKLDNIRSLADHLGNPHHNFKSIHVAGTNGKGSCSHMLASILQEAGYSVGLYTSPHLKDFRERIKINGVVASKQLVVDFVHEHKDYLDRHKLSFFEMTVGMAFDHFAKEQVDIAIIEVGLGGRLDSTNIINPEISLITNIGWDHTDILGEDLDQITSEKAGIIKPEVPVVISEYTDSTSKIFSMVAKENGSPIFYAEEVVKKNYKTALLGDYQQRNVKGVVATILKLPGFEISEQAIIGGLQNVVENTGLLGRWQILSEQPKIICDTAHNKEGIAIVLKQLQKQQFRRLHLVLGFVEDKNLDVILPLFPKDAFYYLARPAIRRGLDVLQLQQRADHFGLENSRYKSVQDALKAAKSNATKEDVIFVGGSTFTVAEVL